MSVFLSLSRTGGPEHSRGLGFSFDCLFHIKWAKIYVSEIPMRRFGAKQGCMLSFKRTAPMFLFLDS